MDTEVFLDTAYAIALANAKDQFHWKAVNLAKLLRAEKTKLVTTCAVLLEIGNALSSNQYGLTKNDKLSVDRAGRNAQSQERLSRIWPGRA